jgi:hypothetical protein
MKIEHRDVLFLMDCIINEDLKAENEAYYKDNPGRGGDYR